MFAVGQTSCWFELVNLGTLLLFGLQFRGDEGADFGRNGSQLSIEGFLLGQTRVKGHSQGDEVSKKEVVNETADPCEE